MSIVYMQLQHTVKHTPDESSSNYYGAYYFMNRLVKLIMNTQA